MSRNDFFSSRSEEKRFLWRWYCGKKNKSKCGLSWSVLLPKTSTCHYSFPKHFFVLFLHIKRVYKSFIKGKSDAYKQLICIMQRVHFQVRVGVFSCQDKYLFRCLWYCGKNKSNVVKRGLYSCRQRYASLQWSKCCATIWATSQSARFASLSTSPAYTHGQIVDAGLANQSAHFALVM